MSRIDAVSLIRVNCAGGLQTTGQASFILPSVSYTMMLPRNVVGRLLRGSSGARRADVLGLVQMAEATSGLTQSRSASGWDLSVYEPLELPECPGFLRSGNLKRDFWVEEQTLRTLLAPG
jgi:hypothetical protein